MINFFSALIAVDISCNETKATYAESGKVIDEALAGAPWMSIWGEAMALVDKVVSDNFERCQIIYSAG